MRASATWRRARRRHEKIPALAALGRLGEHADLANSVSEEAREMASLIEDVVAAGDAARALLLLLAGLGRIMLLGEQFEAHRLRAFIFNFEIARHRGSADV
jgi:hypothetical protein